MLRSMLRRLPSAFVIMLLVGCSGIQSQRVVLIPPVVWVDGKPSDVLRIGPGASGRVFVRTEAGVEELSQNVISFPEGWLLIPPPPEELK